MSRSELASKVKELRELRRMADELNAEIEAIQGAIKAQMAQERVDTLTGDDYRVTWKNVVSSRFDGKAFKAAMPDLYARFTCQTETRRFVLV